MAYHLPHLIGLTMFGSEVTQSCELTELFVNFQGHIDAAQPSGSTMLYDALAKAQEQLDAIGTQFPKCLKRILLLTDGEDTGSSSAPEVIAASLQVLCCTRGWSREKSILVMNWQRPQSLVAGHAY